MANNINWGKVYESTWWGDQVNTAQSAFDYATPTFNAPFLLKNRIITDGGVLESTYCLSLTILNLSQI
jgi:hypothetical protein